MTNLSSAALLNDVFEFEKEKMRLIQSFPPDDFIWKNEVKATDSANQVFNDENFREKAEVKLTLLCMTIESEWDWAQNHVLFTRVKGNYFENNFLLPPHYYQTLLFFDKHHVEVIEYLLSPIEAYLLSILSKENFISLIDVTGSIISFFEKINESEISLLLEEAIRFLSYSGVSQINGEVNRFVLNQLCFTIRIFSKFNGILS